MKFQLRPILSEIKEFYQKPISPDRFKAYISKLEGGTKGDLKLPIAGFNPMAKDHVIQKIEELEAINAEQLMDTTIQEFNKLVDKSEDLKIEVVLNLADDLKGGWTNSYTSDYDSKFKLNALVSRNFCTPYFWTSEKYNERLIQIRTKEYLNRTLYWLLNSKPKTLEEHMEQEIFVYTNVLDSVIEDASSKFTLIEAIYQEYKNTEQSDFIFNFLYGDEASERLAYKTYGIKEVTGYAYANHLAGKRQKTVS